ncbi:hypothetical protein SprV_0602223700 [Sparganum proliferum]
MSARTRQICKGEHTDCTPVPYTTGDPGKDASCRKDCAKKRDNLTEKTMVYYCKTPNKACKKYKVYGRRGYSMIFDRHVMCVRACQLVGQVENDGATSLQVCRDFRKKCLDIVQKNGTFDAFRLCVPKCSGWTDLQSKNEHTAYICPESGDCQRVIYFTTSGGKAFKRLKICMENCMYGRRSVGGGRT